VQVAVEEGLGAGHEGVAEVGDLGAQAGVGAEGRRQVVHPLVPVVVFVLDVRLGEDHVVSTSRTSTVSLRCGRRVWSISARPVPVQSTARSSWDITGHS